MINKNNNDGNNDSNNDKIYRNIIYNNEISTGKLIVK